MWFSNSLTAQTQLEIFDCTIHRRVLRRPTQFHSLAARRPVRRPVCVVAYCILLLRRQPRQQVLLFYARHSVDPHYPQQHDRFRMYCRPFVKFEDVFLVDSFYSAMTIEFVLAELLCCDCKRVFCNSLYFMFLHFILYCGQL